MSDHSISQHVDVPPSPIPAEAPSLSHKIGGQTLRFDTPEMSFSEPAAVSAGITRMADQSRWLAEAVQFAQQLPQQMEDLTRREQLLNQRQAQIEHEERRSRLWISDAEAELAERKAVQQAHEAALAERLSEFERRQRELESAADRLAADQEILEQQRAHLRQDTQRELEEERATLRAERQAVELQQIKVQELGDALLVQHRTQQERVAQQLRQEREQLWITLNAEWEEKRDTFDREHAEYLKDRTLLENRIRFQQDHLEKTRAELEADQTQLARDQQITRQRLELAEVQLQRRQRQLDRHRAALEELGRALERERELTVRERAAISSTVLQEQQQFLADRQTWEADRRQQQTELRRQQETLLTHAENLETRRQRLETLRREVEETNQTTMQLRLAVEEIWAQAQQSLGSVAAQERVDAARQEIQHAYEHYQARLGEQRRELLEAERILDEQRLAFQEERRSLSEWMTQRDEELALREQRQKQQYIEQTTADHDFQQERDRWLNEKSEAERIIRRLLDDLIERTTDLPEPDASAIAAA